VNNIRKAKIVCTLGPASSSKEMIDKLIHAGMDVARLNYSHGTHEDRARMVKDLRKASARRERPIAVLADLQGPKIRTGKLEMGKTVLLYFG
jgi:pyruvate kinase